MKVLFTAALLHIALVSVCQEKRELNWQDFKNSVQNTDVVTSVPWGSLTVFQIKDINKFLYKVTISGRSFELLTPMPSELQTLFRQTPSDLQKGVTNTKANEAANQAEAARSKVSRLQGTMQKDRGAEDEPSLLEQALGELTTKFQDYSAAVRQAASDVLRLKRSRNQLVSIAQKDMSFASISTEVAGVDWPIPNIESNYLTVRERYEELFVLVENAKSLAEGDDDKLRVVTAVENNLKRAEKLLEEEAFLTLIDDINYLYTELANESNFTVVAPPVQMDGDIASYEISITPTNTRTLAPYRNPMKFTFDVPTKGGLKVDFSVGPAVSFGDNAKDEKYFLEETTNPDVVKLRKRSNNNTITPSLGAFMHAYPRSGGWASVGAMFGVGVGFQSTSELNANLYFGLTGVLGKHQKIMASLGVSYLKVDRIKDTQFKEENQYQTSKISLDDVTERVYKPSAFFSITYNLSSRKEIVR